ncbi:hydroxypyruvate reductase [Aureimonas sp. Leaf454]|uniref:glycerate kinase type-2 family protein n=1 Tax=Aureimonas sp. Leaf454 TaxID=1736381 RepID=UPI0006F352FD|nr:glycerate kinase [Aureimonas sp. Leaf454]KQT53747.1 hydroxypyruvate reductase [Aureimonas sp. Leaf454]
MMPSLLERDDETLLKSLFSAALRSAMPAGRFEGRLPDRPKGRTIVLGAGKAAASMAAAFESAWGGPCEGLVVTRYGHRVPTQGIEVVEASHPVPDAAGEAAARRILALAESAGPDDLVVALISGGASALLAMPAAGIAIEDKQALNRALLRSGAPIHEMNRVRKALSAIKGGRLLQAAHPARVATYVISDVPGDDPAVIGSGPTIPDATDPDEVLSILRRYEITLEDRVLQAMEANRLQPQAGATATDIEMLATPMMALEAAAEAARAAGIEPIILGDAIEGEACEVAREHAKLALDLSPERPVVILSGGETTVTVRGAGRGGRNSEYLLALALAMGGRSGISAIACDTDGIDGSEDNAGAWFDADILRSATAKGIDLAALLDRHDSYTAFEALDRLVVTGPTFTNVNDFRAILLRP